MLRRKLPLHDWHEAHEAKLTQVGGCAVPNFYTKVEKEYIALRQNAGIVDNCHRSLFRIEADDPIPFLNRVLTIDVERIPTNKAARAFMLNRRGGIIDRFTVYRDEDYFLLLGSESGHDEALAWLKQRTEEDADQPVWLTDASDGQGLVSVLGPSAAMLLERAGPEPAVKLDRGDGDVFTIANARTLIIRRGRGDLDGFDIVAGSMFIRNVWDRLFDAARMTGGVPVGFGALEVYRLESGEGRVGAEIDEATSPLEVSEESLVDFKKSGFYGRRALMHSMSTEFRRALACIKPGRGAKINPGAELYLDNVPVGRVASVATSPMTRSMVGLGFVNYLCARPGTRLIIASAAGPPVQAEVVIPPGRDTTHRFTNR